MATPSYSSVHDKTTSKPPTPSKTALQSRPASNLPSTSKAAPQPRTTSKPPSSSKPGPKPRAASKPPSSSKPGLKPSAASKPASSSKPGLKPSAASKPASSSKPGPKPSAASKLPSSSKPGPKPPSSSHVSVTHQSHDASKAFSPSQPARKLRIASIPSSPTQSSKKNEPSRELARQSRTASIPSSPSQSSNKDKASPQPSSRSGSQFQLRDLPKANSQPSSPSPITPPRRVLPKSQASPKQQRTKKTSPNQSPSTSQQHVISHEDQQTNRIIPHPQNEASESRSKIRETQSDNKSIESSDLRLKPLESKALLPNRIQTKEELAITSHNRFDFTVSHNSAENSIQSNQAIESNEREETKKANGNLIKQAKMNGLAQEESIQNSNNTSELNGRSITSTKSCSSSEEVTENSSQKEAIEDFSKVFQEHTTAYSSEENPMESIAPYKGNLDENPEIIREREDSFKYEMPQDSRSEKNSPLKISINHNSQGINNSILMDFSFTERNSGISMNLQNFRWPKYTVSPVERLTHEPTVRRKWLNNL